MKRKRPEWEGELATPIEAKGPRYRELKPTIFGDDLTEQQKAEHAALYDAEMARQLGENLRKIELLKEHFAVPDGEGGLIALVIVLARYADIPGFRIVRRGEGRGRKKDAWPHGACIGLILDVAVEKERIGTKSDKGALSSILGRKSHYEPKPMRNAETKKRRVDALAVRLNEARKLVKKKKLDAFCDHRNPLMVSMFVDNRADFAGVMFEG